MMINKEKEVILGQIYRNTPMAEFDSMYFRYTGIQEFPGIEEIVWGTFERVNIHPHEPTKNSLTLYLPLDTIMYEATYQELVELPIKHLWHN